MVQTVVISSFSDTVPTWASACGIQQVATGSVLTMTWA